MLRSSDGAAAPMNRRLLVAGATGLVGTAVAESAAAQGTDLVLLGRSADRLQRLAARLEDEHGVTALPLAADVTDPASLDHAVDRARATGLDRLDAVVSLVTGYRGRPLSVADLSAAEFREVLDTDVIGGFLLVRSWLALLRAAPAGRVVLVSSVAGLRGRPMAAHLCAAKAGVHGLVLGLSAELAAEGIGVRCVAPGPISRPGARHPPSPIAPTTPERVAAAVLGLTGADTEPNGEPVIVTGEPEWRPSGVPGPQSPFLEVKP
ncbi:SDR family oxidoreductase [Streptomyces canus]|uniref:SDR family NAD(P)-dependent oxidoreductase n=1 Tax=Streptomyces canus TaxID=58343 RepID=UPI00386BFB26|nr:SDR family oxidoreductase [Streptomyces canus]